jgi:anti-sigma B factor antagonist
MTRMNFQMDYTLDETNDRWDVTLSGEIDIFNSADLKNKLTGLLQERDAHLYLHCKNLEFIDSTALGALVGVLKNAKGSGREIHLLEVKPNLTKLFRITNLDKVFVLEGSGGDA